MRQQVARRTIPGDGTLGGGAAARLQHVAQHVRGREEAAVQLQLIRFHLARREHIGDDAQQKTAG